MDCLGLHTFPFRLESTIMRIAVLGFRNAGIINRIPQYSIVFLNKV